LEKKITENTLVSTILNDPLLKRYQSIIFPLSTIKLKFISLLNLSTYCKLFNYQGLDSIVKGLNRLNEVAKLENQLYFIYSDKEIKNDYSKKEVAVVHFPSNKEEKKPFVLLCAGGGYQCVCSIVEAFPIAEHLNGLGYPVFVLHYRTKKNAHFPNPINDIARAIRWIIEHKDEFNIEITGYSMGGFSAGGHMVASFGTSTLGYSQYNLPKPSALFLSYPVISMGEYSHKETKNSFLGGKKKDRKFQERYSIEKQVDRDYPAVYIWTSKDDNCVSSKNSTMLVEALEKNSVPYLYNSINGTAHGLGLGKGMEAEGWLDKAVDFWESSNIITK
jgi:acetyl esterase/lipase